jgi:hypothetical protein
LTVDCCDDATLLSFLWEHVQHENFSFFEYDDGDVGDVGFVCYCHGGNGYSLVLRLSDDLSMISEAARDVVVHCLASSHDDGDDDGDDEDVD